MPYYQVSKPNIRKNLLLRKNKLRKNKTGHLRSSHTIGAARCFGIGLRAGSAQVHPANACNFRSPMTFFCRQLFSCVVVASTLLLKRPDCRMSRENEQSNQKRITSRADTTLWKPES